MQGICLDYVGTQYGATAEVMVKMLSALKERVEQLNLILKIGNGKAKEKQKQKKEKRKIMVDILGIKMSQRNKIYANIKYPPLHLLSSKIIPVESKGMPKNSWVHVLCIH